MSEEFEFYQKNKSLLINASKQGVLLKSKEKDGHVGLLNQGATCYLNSVLQCLFNNKHFRSIVFSACPDSSPMVKELQLLFSNMLLSNRAAVSTQGLLEAFGWSRSQMFEQHDIHEFFGVLIEALGKVSEGLSGDLKALFQGASKDTLACSECGFQREMPSSFLNISIDIPDQLENEEAVSKGYSLVELIDAQLQPETLEDDNKWECDQCKKKVLATKALEYQTLPRLLLLHLKRFRFDPTTKRRRKLSTPIAFPPTLDSQAVLKANEKKGTSSPYRLYGAIVHNGTAMGGHYHAYIQSDSSSQWANFNDANVTVMSTEDEQALLWNENMASQGSKAMEHNFVHQNVYMLLYERTDGEASAASTVPKAVAELTRAANAEYDNLLRLHEARQNIVELEVHLLHPSSHIHFAACLRTEQYSVLLRKIYDEFLKNKLLDANTCSIQNCRLRKYNRAISKAGETFGDREAMTLNDLGFDLSEAVLLETRTDSDPQFVEYNPDDMYVQLVTWSADTASAAGEAVCAIRSALASPIGGDSGAYDAPAVDNAREKLAGILSGLSSVEALVPGRQNATVGQLRATVASSLSLAADRFLIIYSDSTQATAAVILTPDMNEAELVKEKHIFSGATITVELLADGVSSNDAGVTSSAMEALELQRTSICILFNNPFDEDAASAAAGDTAISIYTHNLNLSSEMTLFHVRKRICNVLKVNKDTNPFHFRRNGTGAPQLKDETKTLAELAIANHSILHLQRGAGCNVGEHLLHLEWDVTRMKESLRDALDPAAAVATAAASEDGISKKVEGSGGLKLIPIGDLAAPEKFTVLHLKQLIHEQWSNLVGARVASLRQGADAAVADRSPPTPSHIRLRDLKGGKLSGPLRDDRVLVRCLLGLSDGRRLLVQTLAEEEKIGADDLVLSLRVVNCGNRSLEPATDLPMRRGSTVKQLYEAVLAKCPYLSEEASADELEAAAAGTDVTTLLPEAKTIGLAKGFTSGPPLGFKSALKLKFNDPTVCSLGPDGGEATTLDTPPLNLRDGSLIVVYNQADCGRMQMALKIKREAIAAANGSDAETLAAGSGIKATRARSRGGARANSRGGTRFRPPAEKPVKIDVTGGGMNIGALLGGDTQAEDVQIFVKGPPPKTNNENLLSSQSTPSLGQQTSSSSSPPKPVITLQKENSGNALPPPQ